MQIEQVISNYQSALRAFLMSRLRNAADVDDVLQEVLTKTFLNLETLKAGQKIKPWLFQIANNAVMDHYRRKTRERAVQAEDLWYGEMAATEHAFEGCVVSFLDALPAEAAALLRAIEIEGVSQKDYAQLSGVSYSTLKSRVQSGRKQLRGLFDQCCDIALATDGSVLDYHQKTKGCRGC